MTSEENSKEMIPTVDHRFAFVCTAPRHITDTPCNSLTNRNAKIKQNKKIMHCPRDIHMARVGPGTTMLAVRNWDRRKTAAILNGVAGSC